MSNEPRIGEILLADAPVHEWMDAARVRLDARIATAGNLTPGRTRARRPKLKRSMTVLVASVALAGTALGVPATRSLLTGSWGSWLGGSTDTPGREVPLSAIDPPNGGLVPTEGFELASSGAFRLTGYRNQVDGTACFGFVDSGCFPPAVLQTAFAAAPIWLFELAPVGASGGILAGVTSDEARWIRLEYADGTAATTPSPSNGFVLKLKLSLAPRRLVALDASGSEIGAVAAPFVVGGLVAFPDALRPETRDAWTLLPPR